MIDQPEIGILAFLITNNENNREWLIQNKPEPGNVGFFQYAPSVQATKSNYEQVHGGAPTPYLEFFIGNDEALLVSIENSEQGDRFLNKFNRNAKHLVPDSFRLSETALNYKWISNCELKQELRKSFKVNTDARSVITSGAWYLLATDANNLFLSSDLPSHFANALNQSYKDIKLSRLNQAFSVLKKINHLFSSSYTLIPLNKMKHHTIDSAGIYNSKQERIVGYYHSHIPDREKPTWQQPLLERSQSEECVLLFIIKNNIAYFNVAAYPEIGFKNRVEFGGTFQTGKDPFKISTTVLAEFKNNMNILCQIEQSDEGGRFYQNNTKYTLAYWKHNPDTLERENSAWLSAAELEQLSMKKGTLTNELRTLLSLLLSFG